MRFNEFDSVKVRIDCNEFVKKGDIGIIIMAFTTPDEAYEVEFLDDDGNTKSICTLKPDDLESYRL